MEPIYLEDTPQARQAIIDGCLWMNARGLNQGRSGNISLRTREGLLVTPSAVPYDKMTPDMIQSIPHSGAPEGKTPLKPTTEWRIHQSVLAARPDVAAVVHAHPPHATAVAVQRRIIPACHYMVAAFGGSNVPLVDYALFGGEALAQGVAEALSERTGCLMANHGAVTVGTTLERALWRMEELENLARVFLLSGTNGAPVILDDAEMAEVAAAFSDYGADADIPDD